MRPRAVSLSACGPPCWMTAVPARTLHERPPPSCAAREGRGPPTGSDQVDYERGVAGSCITNMYLSLGSFWCLVCVFHQACVGLLIQKTPCLCWKLLLGAGMFGMNLDLCVLCRCSLGGQCNELVQACTCCSRTLTSRSRCADASGASFSGKNML